jgi:hypothetical protein
LDHRHGQWHYHYAGLLVTSELRLPEWRAFESAWPLKDPDVVIRLQRGAASNHEAILTADRYQFSVNEVGDYWVTGGREIRIAMNPVAGEREARLFLLGSAWSALCYQRGILVLHASVVQVRNQAVAFCGPSGSGKSSVAAWLSAHGYPLICDDLCRFDVGGESARVYPGARRLKLWSDALDYLGWMRDGLERDHFRMEKYHIPMDQGFSAATRQSRDSPLPLRAVYLLAWGDLGISRLTGLAALHQLVASGTYRGDLLEPFGRLAEHWQRCAELARCVPVFTFTRPNDWASLGGTMRRLVAHWQVAGVT